jgi:hypothetical protein
LAHNADTQNTINETNNINWTVNPV